MEKKVFKNIDVWWFNSSYYERVHFCHEGVQRVQNASREYTKHVRVNDNGFQEFDSKEDFLQKSMPKAVTQLKWSPNQKEKSGKMYNNARGGHKGIVYLFCK